MSEHDTGGDATYELTDVKAKMAVIGGIACCVLCAFSFLVGYFVMKYFTSGRDDMSEFVVSPLAGESQWETDIRLQVNLPEDYAEHKRVQERSLTEYDVISESPDIFQVPIEVAIEWVAEEGLPTIESLPTLQPIKTGQ